MKKTVSVILAVIVVFFAINPINVYAQEQEEWKDIVLTKSEIDEFLVKSVPESKATGLIAAYSLGINKSGNDLIIVGTTECKTSVVKCGFKELVIQRRADSTQDWIDYVTYEDLYYDSFVYSLSKSITVGTGYQYRVTAIHYAKKNIFSTEKINNTSNTVVFA